MGKRSEIKPFRDEHLSVLKNNLSSEGNEVSENIGQLQMLAAGRKMREAKLYALRAEIQKGIDDLEAGRFQYGEIAMANIKKHLLSRKPNNG